MADLFDLSPDNISAISLTLSLSDNNFISVITLSFCSLLNSQVGCIRMTTEAVLNQSKSDAYFALLADPVVDNARSAEKLLDTIIELQNDYLGYLN